MTTQLKDKALLVSLNVGKPRMTEKDKQTTSDVALDKGASTNAVAVIKRLYPKHLLAPIQEVESAARRYVESVTQPWARGLYLLPSILFMDFQQKLGEYQLAFGQAVTVFLNNHTQVLSSAQSEQGTMFNASDYPDMSEIKRDFSFGVRYLPMGEVPSLMDGLEASVLADVRQEVEAATRQAMADGQRALYERLGAAVQRIATQCGNEKGHIHDSLTGNLEEMLKVLPALNLSGDPAFAAICVEAQTLVVVPEALRTVPAFRETVADKAKGILAQMEGFL